MMQYEVTKEKSAEHLRQAIHHMAMQDAAFHPVSYAVWYEYSSGEHARLIEEVNALIEKEKKLNEKSTAHMFNKHIAGIDADNAKKLVDRFSEVVTDMRSSTEKAGLQTNQYTQTLDAWSNEIQQKEPQLALQLDSLLSETLLMKNSMQHLQGKLSSSLEEIDGLKNEMIKARQEALQDGLTGLMNRKGFDVVLHDCLQQHIVDTSLIIADIDHFKKVNDNYGHLFGDKVIQAVANIFKATAGNHYTAARYGGEEFVLLLPNTRLETAQEVAEQIRHKVASINIKNTITQHMISNITISLGVAAYQAGEQGDDLISHADQALYTAKANGRNQVVLSSQAFAAA